MTEDQDRRRPPAPHCYRVVQLGINLRSEIAPALADRTTGTVVRRGKTIAASTLFEPKVGGGGHLLLMEDGVATPWARLLVEPDGPIVNLNAAIFDGDWDVSDDVLATEARQWLRALHGIDFRAHDLASSPPSVDGGPGASQ
jgi:hypothetical protein